MASPMSTSSSTSSREKSTLLTIPHELLFHILTGVEPEDLHSLRGTSRGLRDFIGGGGGSGGVWRGVLGGIVDEPPSEFRENDWDWQKQNRDLVALRSLYGEYPSENDLSLEEKILLSTKKAISLISNATFSPTSLNISFLAHAFNKDTLRGLHNIETYLCQSLTYTRSFKFQPHQSRRSFACRQASAKLHVYSGVPLPQLPPERYHDIYPYAMSVVYDMRNYTDETLWGPMLGDGRAGVDWEKMEAVMLVLARNLQTFESAAGRALRPLWVSPWFGCQKDSYRGVKLRGKRVEEGVEEEVDEEKRKLREEDPYNVSGSWMRVVTFLDYHELSYYNYELDDPPADQPRPPISTIEAIRLIMMELEVTSIKPDRDPDQKMPVVSFKGIARSLHTPHDPNANSNIRGWVRMTEEGEVRWTTVSVYNGEERWKSEGIQVGGLRSARGVLGHWFDKDMDNQQGPAGPTAFWKISDEIDEAKVDEWIDGWGSDSDDEEGDDPDFEDDGEAGAGTEVSSPSAENQEGAGRVGAETRDAGNGGERGEMSEGEGQAAAVLGESDSVEAVNGDTDLRSVSSFGEGREEAMVVSVHGGMGILLVNGVGISR